MSGIREVSPGSFIFEKKDALPDFLCDDMVNRFETQPEDQNRGRVGSDVGENTQLKKTTDIFVSNKPHWKDVDNNLFRSLAIALNEFKEAYPFFADMSRFKDMGYNLQRYQPGEFYHWHIDGDNQELATRQLVALWYLNDVPVSSGGATEFYYQNASVQPEKGKLMLFPPFWTHQHRAQEILSGSKYIATTWLHFR